MVRWATYTFNKPTNQQINKYPQGYQIFKMEDTHVQKRRGFDLTSCPPLADCHTYAVLLDAPSYILTKFMWTRMAKIVDLQLPVRVRSSQF